MGLSRQTQQRISDAARHIGAPLVVGICRTLRLEVEGWTRLQTLMHSGTPIILQFWHGDMFIPWYLTAPLKPAAIVSQAGDGDIASAVLEGLNFVTFRGSSTRGGKRAYLGLMQYLKRQPVKVSAFASDGPRGPRREMKPGTLAAAQHLKGVIIPVAAVSRWSLRAKGWDKFAIPLPFSRAKVSFGAPIAVSKHAGDSHSLLQEVSTTCRQHQEALEASFLG